MLCSALLALALAQVLLDPHAPRSAGANVYAFGVVLCEIMQVWAPLVSKIPIQILGFVV
jgi:hypothetical protein